VLWKFGCEAKYLETVVKITNLESAGYNNLLIRIVSNYFVLHKIELIKTLPKANLEKLP